LKLFLIVMVWGQVGISVGPLPDAMPDCLTIASQRLSAIQAGFGTRDVIEQNGKLIWKSDIVIGCGYFPEQPAGGSTIDTASLQKPTAP
jgi:hypothetical protein